MSVGQEKILEYSDTSEELWKLKASCIGMDESFFFLERGQNTEPMVLRMCAACPVRQECLDYAVKYCLEGIWAGTSDRQRRKLRK